MSLQQPHPTKSPAPGRGVEDLLNELAASGRVRFSVLSSDHEIFLTVTLRNPSGEPLKPGHAMEFWVLDSGDWIAWLRVNAVTRLVFARGPDPHAPAREALSVRFYGANTPAFLRAAVVPLYDEGGEPIAERFDFWTGLRRRYGDQSELTVNGGEIQG